MDTGQYLVVKLLQFQVCLIQNKTNVGDETHNSFIRDNSSDFVKNSYGESWHLVKNHESQSRTNDSQW